MIWSRYLFKSLTKTFLFLLISIFVLYTIVDLSMNGIRFFSYGRLTFFEVAKYYVYTFFNQHLFFFPLCFLFASLKIFFDLNRHNELVALQMAGLSQKTLLRPFFSFALILMIASYSHQEWIAPTTQIASSTFRDKHSKHKKKNIPHLYNVALQDQSELVYQNYQNDELFDVFWIKNSKDIWHMKYLKLNPTKGIFVDHFQRTSEGIEKTESFTELDLPQITFDPNICLRNFIPIENRPLSTLISQAFKKNTERKNVLCQLHYILASPLISILFLIAITPLTFRFSRSKNAFLITALSVFAFVAFKTILDGMMILGENHVLPSFLAIWGPIFAVLALAMPRFVKI